MATAYKVLAQANPAATTEATLYTPSGATSAVVSTLVICNQAGADATYRVGVWPSGTSSTVAANWTVYGATVKANDSTFLTIGLTLENGAKIRVWGSTSTISFQVYGSEN